MARRRLETRSGIYIENQSRTMLLLARTLAGMMAAVLIYAMVVGQRELLDQVFGFLKYSLIVVLGWAAGRLLR